MGISGIQFQQETVDQVKADLLPLVRKHYDEIVLFKDIPLSPNFDAYRIVEAQDKLAVYTARKDGKLIGYSVFFVNDHPHFQGSLQAANDLLFIDPDHRGFGVTFLRFCDECLEARGVEVIHYSSTPQKDLSKIFEYLGYHVSEVRYSQPISHKRSVKEDASYAHSHL